MIVPLESDDGLELALEALRSGQVVGLPTDTVYGLAVDPRVKGAAGRLFEVKGRPEEVALPLLISEVKELHGFAEPDKVIDRLVRTFWPGPLTLVVERRAGVVVDLGGDPSTVGLRCPGHGGLRRLLFRSRALAVTSANLHGEPPLHEAAELVAHFGPAVDVVVDGGRCDGAPSTVVSLLGPEPVCLREGAVSMAAISSCAAGPS